MSDLSVILPYFDRQDVLAEAINSVLNQTFKDFDLILIDDGSTDRSGQVAHSFDDPRIVHVSHQCNLGVVHARNSGIRAALTPLIAFMDSDDRWMPRKLEIQIEFLRELQSAGEPVSVVGCGWRSMGSNEPHVTFWSDGVHRGRVRVWSGR